MSRVLAILGLLAVPVASAAGPIAEECQGIPEPRNYNERVQQDFLQNYPALATTLSPVHGPVPHEPSRGAMGLDVGVMPPLSCEKRFVLDHTKTEDTNKSPVVPRLRATFAFPELGPILPYAGVAYMPPVQMLDQRTALLSGEIGAGLPLGDLFQTGLRFHYTQMKTTAEIATPFEEGDAVFVDFFAASTFGLDAMAGLDLGPVVPYLAGGITDVSTFFYIGDDGVSPNNLHPYLGPVFSLGADGLLGWFRFGAEFYAAPGGVSRPDKKAKTVKNVARYGRLYTGRVRLAVEF